jgi:hypothetical protein
VYADALPTSEKPSPAVPSIFTVAALVVGFEACLTRDMVASSVSSCEIALLGETGAQGLPFAIKRETTHRLPFIFIRKCRMARSPRHVLRKSGFVTRAGLAAAVIAISGPVLRRRGTRSRPGCLCRSRLAGALSRV